MNARLFSILPLCFLLVSCGGLGSSKIDDSSVDKIQIGKTTAQELKTILGNPYSTSSFYSDHPDCGKNWTQNTYYQNVGLGKTKLLSVSIDNTKGIVCSKSYTKVGAQ